MKKSNLNDLVDQSVEEIAKVLLGKKHQIKLALSCLYANGHLLIEDFPGVGKTTLAEAIAKIIGMDYKRVQCTNDMMPSDIIGLSILDQATHDLLFKPGPIFTNLLLADEINRSTPKTQSALLEAMEERQVSTEGVTRKLNQPFFVIATQNPLEQAGTFPLPESQLDRFLMRISIGYPDNESESQLLMGIGSRSKIQELKQILSTKDLLAIHQQVKTITVNENVVKYILRIIEASRLNGHFKTGLSPRAGIAVKQAAQAWAFMQSRDYVIPQDVVEIASSVCRHRLLSNELNAVDEDYFNQKLIETVAID